jgi:hypothetical protein
LFLGILSIIDHRIQFLDLLAIIGGLILGIYQWQTLRKNVVEQIWWAITLAVASFFLFAAIDLNPMSGNLFPIIFVGAIAGCLKGITLIFQI